MGWLLVRLDSVIGAVLYICYELWVRSILQPHPILHIVAQGMEIYMIRARNRPFSALIVNRAENGPKTLFSQFLGFGHLIKRNIPFMVLIENSSVRGIKWWFSLLFSSYGS